VHRKEFFHGLCVAQVQCRLERVKNQLCTRMFVHVLGLDDQRTQEGLMCRFNVE
jgi:hypothetical protein